MAVLALLCALATATCIGYYLGRRAGSRPPTWKQRTSRVALGKLAISLLVAVTARRILRLRTVGPVDILRAGMARIVSY
ncbi:hypothetical protein A5712_29735 [Mycobacterium sp. E2327]|uniref:hypothetical protein n=1 Tax=Mycobacterium sp. E2327 TaxID=1834132 RepID=UPI0007FEF018|nr:hypothetical protein [Mycobacterium sp. E2327]OBI14909.1 hypothetical protein A5712_29735 [Mycobacterium sp. E2327]